VAVLRGHTGQVTSAAFSPDGKWAVTASRDRTGRVYACELCVPLDELVALAKKRATRELTAGERAKYLPTAPLKVAKDSSQWMALCRRRSMR
jgi:hypothetical protein